jgi:hypothetical protein
MSKAASTGSGYSAIKVCIIKTYYGMTIKLYFVVGLINFRGFHFTFNKYNYTFGGVSDPNVIIILLRTQRYYNIQAYKIMSY